MFSTRIRLILGVALAYGVGYFTSVIFTVFGQEKQQECVLENVCGDTLNISVEVGGAVKEPGVYDLKEGSRLIDAVKAAGDFSSDYDYFWVSRNINLSQILKDEQKIFIPFEALGYSSTGGTCSQELFSSLASAPSSTTKESSESSSSSGSSSSSETTQGSGKVNVNTATFDELDALPGIGAVYAGKIIENRPYSGVEEFKEKSQVTTSIFDKIKDLISF